MEVTAFVSEWVIPLVRLNWLVDSDAVIKKVDESYVFGERVKWSAFDGLLSGWVGNGHQVDNADENVQNMVKKEFQLQSWKYTEGKSWESKGVHISGRVIHVNDHIGTDPFRIFDIEYNNEEQYKIYSHYKRREDYISAFRQFLSNDDKFLKVVNWLKIPREISSTLKFNANVPKGERFHRRNTISYPAHMLKQSVNGVVVKDVELGEYIEKKFSLACFVWRKYVDKKTQRHFPIIVSSYITDPR